MNTYQLLMNHITLGNFDAALNVSKTKMKYLNEEITPVAGSYQPTTGEEIVFWYEKVNGQNFINLVN